MQKKFVYVILHYNEKSLKDTFECIQSLKKISSKKDYKIIIVENGSNDKSKEILENKYKDDDNIDVVISNENLGFANGNNLGCNEAIKKYRPDYLIVLNNDTYIRQNNFLEKIEEIYSKEKFDILGPYIYDKNLKPQNPQLNLLTNVLDIEKILKKNRKDLSDINQMNINFKIKKILKKIINSNKKVEKIIRKILNKQLVEVEEKIANSYQYNIGLHGSALIFSKKYYNKYLNIFYNKTFMYREEDILYHRVLRDNLISIYSPELEVYHKEDSSTDAILNSEIMKQKFILENQIKSLEVYRELLIKGE